VDGDDVAKTIDEFKEDLRILRAEMYQNSENADLRLIASYLDRLILSLEDLSDTLAVMEAGTEMMLSSEEAEAEAMEKCPCCSGKQSPAKAVKKNISKKKKPGKKRR
jgi:hypothetical protein